MWYVMCVKGPTRDVAFSEQHGIASRATSQLHSGTLCDTEREKTPSAQKKFKAVCDSHTNRPHCHIWILKVSRFGKIQNTNYPWTFFLYGAPALVAKRRGIFLRLFETWRSYCVMSSCYCYRYCTIISSIRLSCIRMVQQTFHFSHSYRRASAN